MLRMVLLAAALSVLGHAGAQSPHTHQHSFSDAEKWAQVFDDPQRDEWQRPHQVIEALTLAPDAHIADIGAGTGYFAAHLAKLLPRSTVYAVDVEPEMVKHLRERAKRERLANLRPVLAKTGDPRLPAKVDLALFVNVYHHIEERGSYFRSLAAALRPGGQVAIIDFRLDSPLGPPSAARVPPEQVKAEMKAAGYAITQDHDFLPHQYFLVFVRRP